MLIVRQIKLKLDEDISNIRVKIQKKLKTKDFFSFKIIKRSLDMRKEGCYSYTLEVDIKNEKRFLNIKDVSLKQDLDIDVTLVNTNLRPIVIGLGPTGLFACYRMIEAGIKPIVFEQGKNIKEREKDIELLFNEGLLNETSNVVFGLGGAGTFSDAKLTTRVKSPFVKYILDVLVKFGADQDILIDNHPHIGTDVIRVVISNMLDYMIEKGLEVHFNEKVIDIETLDNKITKVITPNNSYNSDFVVFAVGHSAKDSFEILKKHHVLMSLKDIAIGFRVEHPQCLINNLHQKTNGKAQEYYLRYQDELNVYSFCMCPGGHVVLSSNQKNTIVTNGMSYHARDNHLANSAILIQLPKTEFQSDDILAGFDYLYSIESKAYKLSNSYKAIAMNIQDYINNTSNPLILDSSYKPAVLQYDISCLFTDKQNEIFKKALKHFDNLIPGFISQGIMVGPETKSSSPIRVERDEQLKSLTLVNLYPCGEGSGFGGGIVSCSIDGIKVADAIIKKISNFI